MPLKQGDYPLDGCNISRNDIITVEGARILWPNFKGAADAFNTSGDRNFNLWLSQEQSDAFAADGWRVKCKLPRPDDEEKVERCTLKISVGYKFKAPRIKMVGDKSRNPTEITEANVALLDDADIKTIDLTFVPYFYTMFEGTPQEANGVTAYLRSMYVEVIEDDLDDKWNARIVIPE